MVLRQEDTRKITSFVKKEPRTIQDIARFIHKTWVTADSYVEKIKQATGQIETKVFRKGTQGAVKVVYWNYEEAVEHDEIKKNLYDRIRLGIHKNDFDPLEIYQHVPKGKKKAILGPLTFPQISSKQSLLRSFNEAEQELYCFSGNNSWMSFIEDGIPVLRGMEGALKRGVTIRILARVDLGSMAMLNSISRLLHDYPETLAIRHARHPLRGWIVDNARSRLIDVQKTRNYKEGELKADLRVFYEWTDPEWTFWLQQVFWNLYRQAPPAKERIEELKEIF